MSEVSKKGFPGRGIVILLLGAPSAVALFSRIPLVSANLGLIDDHEFIKFLSGRRDGSSWMTLLSGTEVGDYPEGERFRPVYYAIRVLESFMFGTSGGAYYTWRLTLVAVLLLAVTWTFYWSLSQFSSISRRSALLISSLAGLFFASSPSLDDIVTRLGPSELYALVGSTILIVAILRLCASQNHKWAFQAVAFIGWVIAAGSKENFLILGVLFLFPLFQALRKKQSWLPSLTLSLAAAGFGTYILSGFLPGVLDDDGDVYGQSRELFQALMALSVLPKFWMALLVSAVAIVATVYRRDVITNYFWVPLSLVPIFVIGSEAFFYQNEILKFGSFNPARYGALTDYIFVASILTLIVLLDKLLMIRKFNEFQKMLPAVVAGALFLSSNPLGFAQDYFAASDRSAFLRAQFEQIQSVSDQILGSQAIQTVIIIDQPYDFERLRSIILYLDFLSADSTISHFAITEIPEGTYSALEIDLAQQLNRFSMEGDTDRGVSPLADFDANEPYICVHFGAPPREGLCNGSIWVGG